MRTSVVGWSVVPSVIASVVAALLLAGAAFAQAEAGAEEGPASAEEDAAHCYLAAEAVEVGPERLLADEAPCSVEDAEAPAAAEATAVAPVTGEASTVTP